MINLKPHGPLIATATAAVAASALVTHLMMPARVVPPAMLTRVPIAVDAISLHRGVTAAEPDRPAITTVDCDRHAYLTGSDSAGTIVVSPGTTTCTVSFASASSAGPCLVTDGIVGYVGSGELSIDDIEPPTVTYRCGD